MYIYIYIYIYIIISILSVRCSIEYTIMAVPPRFPCLPHQVRARTWTSSKVIPGEALSGFDAGERIGLWFNIKPTNYNYI